MNKFKKILGILVATSIIGITIGGYLINRDKVVAVVNGKKISEPLYRSYLWSTQKEFEGISPDIWDIEIAGKKAEDLAKETTLNAIITSIIIKDKAKEYDISLTKEEKQVAKDVAQSFSENKENKILLSKLGFTKKEIEQFMRDETLKNKVMEKMGENYTASEDEIRKKMDEQRKYYEKVRVKHVVIKTIDEESRLPLPEEKLSQAKALAREILDRALAGEDMAQLAKQYSEDEVSRDLGGESTFSRGETVEEFEQAIFEGEEGMVYPKIVTSDYAYHIIKIEEKIPADEEILRADVLQRLKTDFAAHEIKDLINTAKVEKTEHYDKIRIIKINEN